MDITNFYEKNWETFDLGQKINELQKLENEIATIENRKIRKCVFTDNDRFCSKGANAQYNFFTPEIIYVREIDSGVDSALSVIHEGIHAMYDDAFKTAGTKVVSFDKLDVKRLVYERKNKNIIYNHFYHKNCIIIFHLCYIEEQIAHLDSKRFLLLLIKKYLSDHKVVSNSIYQNTQKDLFSFYEKIFIKELNRLNYITKVNHDLGTNYDCELRSIDYNAFSSHVENVSDPIVTTYGDDIKTHFAQQLQIYKNIHNAEMVAQRNISINEFISNFNFFIM